MSKVLCFVNTSKDSPLFTCCRKRRLLRRIPQDIAFRNEALRRKLRGISSGIAPKPYPLSLSRATARSPRHFIGEKPLAKADPLRSKLQSILAKANGPLIFDPLFQHERSIQEKDGRLCKRNVKEESLCHSTRPPAIHASMTSLSNRKTLPMRMHGILPSLDNLQMVI